MENNKTQFLEDLKKALTSHDWYYQYSDDNRWWSAGQSQRESISSLMEKARHNGTIEEAMILYDEYSPWKLTEESKAAYRKPVPSTKDEDKITHREFLEWNRSRVYEKRNQGVAYGLATMEALKEDYPNLYAGVVNTDADCTCATDGNSYIWTKFTRAIVK